ncbi:MAG: polysaccharide biosynthesis C-terminal domain-containing protein, partial [Caldilineaceae bacterium]|nr:polysaccharide biosynthesis C-terminal domain-containing protein [Caldilineaceae bacterium]
RQLLLVFGEEFSEQGALILQILLLGQFANALAGPNGILLVMTKYQSAMVWALLSTLLINLLLLLVLVPKWGIIGIAVATSVAVLFRNIVLCTQVKQRLQINTTIFSSHILKGVLG